MQGVSMGALTYSPSHLVGVWNRALYLSIHATVASPSWLISIAALLAELPLFVSIGLTAAQWVRRLDHVGFIRTIAACCVAVLIELLISTLAFHPRPFAAGLGPAWVSHIANNSMPSTHVSLTWVMALNLASRKQFRVSTVVFCLGGVMAWARVYVGIHWPADMAGAALNACISTTLVYAAERGGTYLATSYQRIARGP